MTITRSYTIDACRLARAINTAIENCIGQQIKQVVTLSMEEQIEAIKTCLQFMEEKQKMLSQHPGQ